MSQRRTVTRAIEAWLAAGRPAVLATVVRSSGSAPRGVGAQLAVTEGDLWVGGLSGGCAEAAVLAQARELLAAAPDVGAGRSVVVTMTKDTLGGVGPVCGATLDVLVERVEPELLEHLQQVQAGLDAGLGQRAVRDTQARRCAVEAVEDATSRSAEWDGVTFVETIPAFPRLIVCGAGDVASELLRLAAQVGWRTALVDPRQAFVEQTLASAAPDVVVRSWPEAALAELVPDARSACVAAAHDEKLDLPFLAAALDSDAFYVGSVGSRAVQRERAEQLAELVGAERAARHSGPAGLDLGGTGAAEIALSIMGELVARWNGRDGGALTSTHGPIRAS